MTAGSPTLRAHSGELPSGLAARAVEYRPLRRLPDCVLILLTGPADGLIQLCLGKLHRYSGRADTEPGQRASARPDHIAKDQHGCKSKPHPSQGCHGFDRVGGVRQIGLFTYRTITLHCDSWRGGVALFCRSWYWFHELGDG